MIIERTSDSVRIRAPAKLNLFLEVLGKRSDGYHAVETVLCPISLFDVLEFTACEPDSQAAEIQLDLRFDSAAKFIGGTPNRDPAWNIPSDEGNLVVRAVRMVREHLGGQQGCKIRLTKSIPAAAGLGGGSSDTAAAVVASLITWGSWDRRLATEICESLGSDISFFLGDEHSIGLAVATGRGEKCSQLAAKPALDFVVCHPPVGCPTPAVYAGFEKGTAGRDFRKIVAACQTGQFQKIGAELFNALQFSSASLTDWIDRQLLLFSECGVQYALMTGSGSSCFALVEDPSSFEEIRTAAEKIGLSRVYSAQAWYGDSIEKQLSR